MPLFGKQQEATAHAPIYPQAPPYSEATDHNGLATNLNPEGPPPVYSPPNPNAMPMPGAYNNNNVDYYASAQQPNMNYYQQQNIPPPQGPLIYVPQQHAVVVDALASRPQAATVITTTKKSGVNHCLHGIITIFFFPWIFVWIILCCLDDKQKRQTTVIKI